MVKTNPQEIETFYPSGPKQWRAWLQKNHDKTQSIWLVCYKKKSGVPTISWSDAVDEALYFGWIDSIRKSVDEHTFIQLFSRRKPRSVWSKINKEKVQRLTEAGLMMQTGFDSIETAQQNGSWSILDDVEELVIPKDLQAAFKKHKGSETYFLGLSRSVRKSMLQWLVLAKRPETRTKRIEEISELAAQQLKPKQFR